MDYLMSLFILMAVSFGFWWLWFVGYRKYRLDKTRQELFRIRDQLLLAWSETGLTFDTQAYCLMRQTLNGMIRYTHNMSIIRVGLVAAVDQKYKGEITRRYHDEFEAALGELDNPEARKLIEDARRDMHAVVIGHLLHSSAFLMALVPVVIMLQVATSIKHKGVEILSPSIDAEAASIAGGHGSKDCMA